MQKLFVFFCAILFVSAGKEGAHKNFDVKKLEKSLVYIPMGSYMFNDSTEAYMPAKKRTTGRMVPLQAFYMCSHEVSNGEYREFLNALKKDTALYKKMLPDTLVWAYNHQYNEPYVKYYFRHPAYQNYPVVGVTHAQAAYYCHWLTEKYMTEQKRAYKKVKFKLPTVYQWEYAAMGGLADARYPWKGDYVTGPNGKLMACFLYVCQSAMKKEKVYVKDSLGNYKEISRLVASPDFEYPSVAPEGENVSEITMPVTAYQPNGYELYNMAGNVCEYVREKGITKGGSWHRYGYYLMNCAEQPYDSAQPASDDRGFRFMMEVEK